MKTALAAAFGFIVSAGLVLAQNRGRNIPPPFDVSDLAGLAVSSATYTATGTANEFVCSTTTNVCEFASSTNAATMTSTMPAVDIGPTATPDANDRLACFSYGASGSKTRVACVDNEGDVSANSFTTTDATVGANAFVMPIQTDVCFNGSTCTSRITTEPDGTFRIKVSDVNKMTISTTQIYSQQEHVFQGVIDAAEVRVRFRNSAVTVADSGGAGAAAFTLAMNTSGHIITCNDADGCNATLGESGALDGQELTLTNVGTNTVNFADTAGVSELAGAFAAGQWDTLTVRYVTDRWVEVARSNN